jgi:hypothetical protein
MMPVVNQPTVPLEIKPYGLAEGWTKPALGLLIAVGLVFLLIGVNSRVDPADPALQGWQIVGP